jgi:PPP family 3-phenylpropionic acid transporter
MLRRLTWLALFCFAPFWCAAGFWTLLGLGFLFGIAYPPLIPLADGLTVLQGRETPGLRYARIRLWGSLAFLGTALGLGVLIERGTSDLVYWTVLGALGLAGLAGFGLPDPRADDEGEHGGRQSRPIRTLCADPRFRACLLATGLIQASHAAYYSFSTLHWRAAGIDEGTIGLLWAEGVVAEILLFGCGAGLAERIGTARLFGLGAAAAALRWGVLALTTDLGLLLATNWLHGLSFGLTHLATVGYIARRVPRTYAATAQSLASAIATGVATAFATICAGALFERSPALAFAAMAVLAGLGGLAALRLGRLNGSAGGG